jgi:hypothetical protein
VTARWFLAALGVPMRQARIEDVRAALESLTAGLAADQRAPGRAASQEPGSLTATGSATRRSTPASVIKVRGEGRSIAKRIISEVQVGLLVHRSGAPGSRPDRDRLRW